MDLYLSKVHLIDQKWQDIYIFTRQNVLNFFNFLLVKESCPVIGAVCGAVVA